MFHLFSKKKQNKKKTIHFIFILLLLKHMCVEKIFRLKLYLPGQKWTMKHFLQNGSLSIWYTYSCEIFIGQSTFKLLFWNVVKLHCLISLLSFTSTIVLFREKKSHWAISDKYGGCCICIILCYAKNCCSKNISPFGWGYRIHWLHICKVVRPSLPNECFGYDTKLSDSEAPALELLGI